MVKVYPRKDRKGRSSNLFILQIGITKITVGIDALRELLKELLKVLKH